MQAMTPLISERDRLNIECPLSWWSVWQSEWRWSLLYLLLLRFSASFSSSSLPPVPVSPPRCCWFTALTHHSVAPQIPQNLGTCQNLSVSLSPPQPAEQNLTAALWSLIRSKFKTSPTAGVGCRSGRPLDRKSNKSLWMDQLSKNVKS